MDGLGFSNLGFRAYDIRNPNPYEGIPATTLTPVMAYLPNPMMRRGGTGRQLSTSTKNLSDRPS